MVAGLEGLRIFRLAEALADEIWEEVKAATSPRKKRQGRPTLTK
jgi:hypothetical protein